MRGYKRFFINSIVLLPKTTDINRKEGDFITQKQQRALAALLTNPTKEAAAKAAGIESRTLRRYLADPDFQAEYQRAVSGMIEDAAAQAKQSLYPALSALRAIIEDGAETASARIQAARTVLEYGLRLTEITDIMKQLDELEKWRDATDGKHERAARSVAGVH
ncbi:MAG: hypothetical protein ACLSBB_16110 [Ruthenibacterium lactatiformans]